MAKCTRKLIDAESAKAAIESRLRFYQNRLRKLELRMGCDMSHTYYAEGLVDGMDAAGGIIDALPDASEGRPKLLASLTSSNGSRDVWWYRQGEDLWESQRIFGVVTHTGSRSLLVDRTSSDPAALELYDNDLSDQPKAIHAERIPVPPHLAEAQRVVIKQAQQAGDGAEEK